MELGCFFTASLRAIWWFSHFKDNYPVRWSRPYGKAVIRRRRLSMRVERKELSVRWSRPMERPPLGGEGYQRDEASSRFTHLIIFTKIQSQVCRKLVAELKIYQCHSFGRSPLCIN
ncbi:hypothetical protein MTR_6g087860 [Medicago truncatula]|uniref:Uncharacterized protein n=1 Tax=Medicago truncatula TaxID=3880 RepID=G7KPF1_MEDTR|nr:hypothetical protein MTR_6g087860 [Medicago truncatula]